MHNVATSGKAGLSLIGALALGAASCGGGDGDGQSRDAAADVGRIADGMNQPADGATPGLLTRRDFNNDGFDDIVVGAPGLLGGEVLVYFGGGAFDTTPDGTLDASGISLGVADFNDDGFGDVIAGSPADGVGGVDAGRVDVFFGGAGATLDAESDWTARGASGDRLGTSVAGAGDVNGDGFGDIVVGAPGDQDTMNGRALVFFGAADPDTGADGSLLGDAAGDAFGASVAWASDVNRDTFDDVIVGAPEAGGTPTTGDGAATLFLGGAGATFDEIADGTFSGVAEEFGTAVLGLGDANGDGHGDFAVGAPRALGGVGRVYVFLGGNAIDSASDAQIEGDGTSAAFFGTTLGAGDFNGDGLGDLSAGFQFLGRVEVYLGTRMALDEIRDHAMDITATSGVAGTVGDLNNDGFDEVAVGGPSASEVRIFLGGNPVDETTSDGTLTGAPAEQFGAALASALPPR